MNGARRTGAYAAVARACRPQGHPRRAGAVFPLINRRELIQRWEKLYGKVTYQGAWNDHRVGKYKGAWNTDFGQSSAPAAQYIAEYADEEYMWDELAAAAWIDPTIITKETSHGAGYGNTLPWAPGNEPGLGEQLVRVQKELDLQKLNRMIMELMTRPTPGSNDPAPLIPMPAKTSTGGKENQ